MKMVVAYVDPGAFDPIREELLERGFLSLSLLQASGSVPTAIVTGGYRGVAVEQHLRPKARIECVVGEEDVELVSATVVKHGGERCFVVVMPVEGVFPESLVKGDTEAASVG